MIAGAIFAGRRAGINIVALAVVAFVASVIGAKIGFPSGGSPVARWSCGSAGTCS